MAMSVQTSVTAAPTNGYAGMLDTAAPHHIATARNGEASAAIPFGRGVVWDPSSPATDRDVTLPATETDIVMGIAVHGQNFSKSWTDGDGNVHGELSSTGLLPGTIFGVLRKGRILVVAEDATTAGTDRLWVRCTVGGVGEVLGGLTTADEGTETIDCTKQGVWVSTAAAGALAWLEVDFFNKP